MEENFKISLWLYFQQKEQSQKKPESLYLKNQQKWIPQNAWSELVCKGWVGYDAGIIRCEI